MKRFIGTATVAALTAFVPYAAAVAQSGKTPNPPNQSVQAEIKRALEAAGFKDMKVLPGKSVVRGKDPAGSPVMMVIDPESFGASAEHVGDISQGDLATGQLQGATSAAATVDAFTQSIVLGANIQNNSFTLALTGGDSHVSAIDTGGGHSHPV
jgi:hypothetical protein